MKTIIYKIRAGRYECTEISDTGGNDIKFVFDEPTDAKLALGKHILSIKGGVGYASMDKLCEGEIHPRLYAGRKIEELEPFVICKGAIIRSVPDEEYLRNLSEHYEKLSERVCALEASIEKISDKIIQKIKF